MGKKKCIAPISYKTEKLKRYKLDPPHLAWKARRNQENENNQTKNRKTKMKEKQRSWKSSQFEGLWENNEVDN